MADKNAKKKKGKGKALSLGAFLQKEDGTIPSEVVVSSWADDVPDDNFADGDFSYKAAPAVIDRAQLPSAPRASRGPDIDLNRVPTEPPFTAYMGNIPFDCADEDIERFFKDQSVKSIRIPESMGRQKGFAYVEFESRQDLLDALNRNMDKLKNREIKVNLATESDLHSDKKGRSGGFDRNDGGEDRTEGDWRRKPAAPETRDGDRADRRDTPGRSFDRDGPPRDFDRRSNYSESRDSEGRDYRGFGRQGDNRDRGRYGGDRDFGNRDDRGYGRRDDRDFGRRDDHDYGRRDDRDYGRRDDRDYGRRDDRDYGRRDDYDRNRGYGRYDDRDNRSFGGRQGGFSNRRDDYNRNDGYRRDRDFDRSEMGRPSSRGGYQGRSPQEGRSQDNSQEPPKERPRLKLQPRTKPVEAAPEEQSRPSSIFGAAKPVDTLKKELEVEERLQHQKELEHKKEEEHRPPPREIPARTDSYEGRPRRTSSSSSGKGFRTVAPPSSRPKRDSGTSHEDVFEGNQNVNAASRVSENEKGEHSEASPPVKLVPAPLPSVNIWEKRKQQRSSGSDAAPSSPAEKQATADKEEAEVSPVQNTAPGGPPSKSAPVAPAAPEKPRAWGSAGSGASIVSGSSQEQQRRRPQESPASSTAPSQPSKRGGPAGGNAWARGGPHQTRGGGRGGSSTGRGGSVGAGRGSSEQPSKAAQKKYEKPLPKSIEEMPKYEEKRSKDFSDGNKFASLLGEEEDLEE